MAPPELGPVINLVVASLSLIICILLLFSLLHSHRATNPIPKTKLNVLRTTYAAIIAYIIFDALTIAINSLEIFEYDETHDVSHLEIKTNVLFLTSLASWVFAQLFLYILLILRVYHSFEGTVYAVRNRVYVAFISLIMAFVISSLVLLGFFIDGEALGKKDFLEAGYGGFQISLAVTDFVVSSFLLILFIKKMVEVTADIAPRSQLLIDDRVSRMNEQQKVLLDITAKYFVCTLISTLWTQMTTLLLFLYWIFVDMQYADNREGTGEIVWDIVASVWVIDGIVNPICLYLIFEVNDQWYRWMCSGCHAFARLCFRKCTQRKIKKYCSMDSDLGHGLL